MAMTNNPANLIIMIVLAAFVIDRLVTASLFLLSFAPGWTQRLSDPVTIAEPGPGRQAERQRKLVYFVLAGVLAFVFLAYYRNIGVMSALRFQTDTASDGDNNQAAASPSSSPTNNTAATAVASPSPPSPSRPTKPQRTYGDFLLTWIILIGGAENIAKLLKGYGDTGGGKGESQPIEITGKLTLEERPEKK